MEAYVHGVSTRKVDDLVAAMGVKEDEDVLVTLLVIYPVTGHRSCYEQLAAGTVLGDDRAKSA